MPTEAHTLRWTQQHGSARSEKGCVANTTLSQSRSRNASEPVPERLMALMARLRTPAETDAEQGPRVNGSKPTG